MNKGGIILLFLLLFMGLKNRTYGQKQDSLVAAIKGSVKDTARNYFLRSATVAVYEAENKKLISYTLTNNYGEFIVNGLPAETNLEVIVSFIGYTPFSKEFNVPANHTLDVGLVILNKDEGMLDSILVTPPPVRMHDDTLEFSAAAFKLGKNAVAEDLLKKLPGVIVWGDGTITVNGRPINKVLVDGKPFYKGGNKVATQNIPKEAIEKVQVYREFIDPNNPYDSISTINFKLRKDKHNGFFGLVSTGIGTEDNYESTVAANAFNRRNQFSIIGQSNNINKLGNDFGTLLRNSTYKGNGPRIEYQPDFNIRGLNKQYSGGLLFTHDFIPNFDQYEQNRLEVNSFLNRLTNNTNNQTDILQFIGNDSSQLQENSNTLFSNSNDFSVSGRYNKLRKRNTFFTEGNYGLGRINNRDLQESKIMEPGKGVLSVGNRMNNETSNSNQLSFKTGIDHIGVFQDGNPMITNWNLSYSLLTSQKDLDRLVKANLIDSTGILSNQDFDRKYNNRLQTLNQGLSFKLGDFGKWLFSNNRTLSKFSLQVEGDAHYKTEKQDDEITDMDSSLMEYQKNSDLSNIGTYHEWSMIGEIKISRKFNKGLAHRYQKDIILNVFANTQFINQQYSSIQTFLNTNKSFHGFIPSANVTYTNFQYGEFVDRYGLGFTTSYILPDWEQQFLLFDSSHLNYIRVGNPRLAPSKNYDLSFSFRHNSVSRKNGFYYGGSAAAGVTDNYFGDSVVTEQNGKRIYYTTNLNGHRYFKVNGYYNKSFLLGHHQFQVNVKANAVKFRNPGYAQTFIFQTKPRRISNVFMLSDSASLTYAFKDLFAVNFIQSFSLYSTKQADMMIGNFKSTNSISRIAISLNPTRKLAFRSNVAFNTIKSPQFPTNKFTILNASLSYRFLKGDNLELKLSGLDLLNQNKGIINFGDNYSFTHGTVNLLHQYFMVKLSYFPRKFGKKNKAK